MSQDRAAPPPPGAAPPHREGITRPSLLEGCRDPRDERAWAELDRRYRELVLSYAGALGLQRGDAEEVCQEVFVALLQRLPEFRYDSDRGRFRSYLGRMVRNSAARLVALRARGAPASRAADPPDRGPEADDLLWEEEWRRHHLRRAMEHVSRSCDAASLLVFEDLLAGLEPEAVATRRALTLSAVYKIKERVKRRLKERVEEQIQAEEGPP